MKPEVSSWPKRGGDGQEREPLTALLILFDIWRSMDKKGSMTAPLIPWRHFRSIKPEESSSPLGGQGLIGGTSVCKILIQVNKTRGVWALGKKGSLTALLILFVN
jgi:hypothetical protein